MPLVYADTSALFAHYHPRDEFSALVDAAVRATAPDFVYWSWLRYELRHNIRLTRQDKHGAAAWNALRASEKMQTRLRWQPDLRADSVLESADELSALDGDEYGAGAGDVLHVAAARKFHLLTGLDEFWTCDAAQAAIAKRAGLPTRLFSLGTPPDQ